MGLACVNHRLGASNHLRAAASLKPRESSSSRAAARPLASLVRPSRYSRMRFSTPVVDFTVTARDRMTKVFIPVASPQPQLP
jgi:hypothetical protein